MDHTLKDGTAPPYGELLQLVESHKESGVWIWSFDDDGYFWSQGCLRLLGLTSSETEPTYDTLLRSVHPEDRADMPRSVDLLRGDAGPEHVFRIIRPDGTTRTVSCRIQIRVSPEGRHRAAWGTLLDVTDREQMIRARANAVGRRRALDLRADTIRFSMSGDARFDFEPAAAELLGRPIEAINADPFALVPADDRDAVRRAIADHQLTGEDLVRDLTVSVSGDVATRSRLVMVATRDDLGRVAAWSGLLQIRGALTSDAAAALGTVERVSTGRDFGAARALLHWSMQDLASASGLSMSTVRRVEQDEEGHSLRSRAKIVSALRLAGIRFVLLEDGSVAVSRNARSSAPGTRPSGKPSHA